ncbi:type II secretion system F family protein [Mycolicibacterium brumae]|uniref:Pilus assembly protein TadC n=1 Tax=Mycolicibacterium brumae TaxID=85968 RepID=A0A2G5P8S8_9MYCO|nr:type II secretion system F family protein [Mycolicibacterium brumae]MCV7193340.1 type II secretion system F family protein [Mycolicibacterium brumae]PIB74752.1 pilus assembly protein TadC [Mycolicibacterium brumae]RWA17764.1 hypothetical protein MBRU_18590 [Mycolicibacterium brumae DSM 44177]UWW07291.1 type II secretion system F family protein [Mycolicibacterium brumae]
MIAALLLAAALLVIPARAHARIRPAPVRATIPDVRADNDPFALAAAFDVLAVCLRAGMPVAAAAAATAALAPPTLARLLRGGADLLALGADPATAWSAAPELDDQCAALLRLARRSAASGAALAQGLVELAEQVRDDARNAARANAERAGVLIAGPLGLCFLPAFVCLGVIPVVAGLAGQVLGKGVL